MTKVPYPEWWNRRARERRVLLDRAVESLRTGIAQLPAVQGALIFGSYARDEVGPESDLDLIVVQDTDEPLVERGRELRRCLQPMLDVSFDLIVYNQREFDHLTATWPFAMQARREGIWIDARASR